MTVSTIRVPITPPERANNPDDYDTQTAAFRQSEIDMANDLVLSIGEFNTDVLLVNSLTERAETAAGTASAAANAPPWVSGGQYFEYNIFISPIEKTPYICLVDHTGVTTDPSLDAVNWKPYVGDAYAPKLSPAFTGEPTGPTPPDGDTSLRLANMEALENALARYAARPIQESEVTTPAAAVILEMTGHEAYELVIERAIPETSGDYLLIEFGDSATNFHTAFGDYDREFYSSAGDTSLITDNEIIASGTVNATGFTGANINANIFPSPDGSKSSIIFGIGSSSSRLERFIGRLDRQGGNNLAATHIRISFSSNNIESGGFFLFPLAGETV